MGTATAVFSGSCLLAMGLTAVIGVDKTGISFFWGFAGNWGATLVFTAGFTAALDATGVADVFAEATVFVAAALGWDLFCTVVFAGVVFFAGKAALTTGLPGGLAAPFDTTFVAVLAALFGNALIAVLLFALATGFDAGAFAADLTTTLGADFDVNLPLTSVREANAGALAVAVVLALLTGFVFTSGLLDGAACACSGSGMDNRRRLATRPSLATTSAFRI